MLVSAKSYSLWIGEYLDSQKKIPRSSFHTIIEECIQIQLPRKIIGLGLPEAGRGPDRSLPPSLPAASAKATEAEAGAAAGEGEGEGEEDVAVVATQAAGAGSPLLVLEEGSRARNNRKRRGENA